MSSTVFPLLVVFGLELEKLTPYTLLIDGTLWPHNVDTDVIPPLRRDRFGEIVDTNYRLITYYSDVPKIFEILKQEGVMIGVTSYNLDLTTTERMIKIFDWEPLIRFPQMRPRNRAKQIQKIHESSGVKYSDMIFFDDRQENIDKVSSLGVLSILVEGGITLKSFEDGLTQFRAKKIEAGEDGLENLQEEFARNHISSNPA